MKRLCELEFVHRFVAALPADPDIRNVTRLVGDACYSLVEPTPVSAPRLLCWSEDLAAELGVARPNAPEGDDPDIRILAGNALARGMRPWAARYGGHQFGHWADQLGDGRAISLGERVTEDGKTFELQLKGAGRTPYSRHADGRAVLRSSLREFLCSEAMHGLGVPTTRALSLVGTGESVVRDMFYDGNPRAEPGAIVCRVSPSFVRFGNFEIHAARGEHATLLRLADFVIARHFPNIDPADPRRHAQWFREVCERTAVMVAHWMRVGFVHGVMNTDNMSILGITLDYGPYGWLERWDPSWTPNTTDAAGRRYAYARQPQIAAWNLARLAAALRSLIDDETVLHAALEHYGATFEATHARMTADKLGLSQLEEHRDLEWLEEMYELLAASDADVPVFFRQLARRHQQPACAFSAILADACAVLPEGALLQRWHGWFDAYDGRIRVDHASGDHAMRQARMNLSNPLYLPRNYLSHQAIEALEQGDSAPLETLLRIMRDPYRAARGAENFAMRRPEWARDKAGCSALSCSS